MKKIIIAPDSFKGTLTAEEVCDILDAAVKRAVPGAETVLIPMSDGGEGMVAAYTRLLSGESHSAQVSGPRGEKLACPFGLLPDGTAVAEMAGCAGLPLMGGQLDPFRASTFGVGELLLALRDRGCDKVLMGIGGSATCDCGIGMAAALGFRFLDGEGKELAPYACNIGAVRQILLPEKLELPEITVACDVDNPLCGPNGACAVFGPQKGLQPEEIQPLDEDIKAFAGLIEDRLHVPVLDVPGAGAAGGLGAALLAFCGAKLTPGIEMLLDASGIDRELESAALVLTGEGRLDGQSMAGKVPVGVSRRAKRAGVPCLAVCGCIGKGAEAVLSQGISAYYAASEAGRSMDELRKTCRADLAAAADRAMADFLSKK